MHIKIDKIIISILILIIIIFSYFAVTNKISQNKVEKKEVIKEEKVEENLIEDEDIKNSIFGKYYEKARHLVTNMTLDEKIGQLFLVIYEKEETENYSNYYPGGYMLYAKDLDKDSKEEMIEELKNLQNQNKYKLILGVDEEGGYVTRVSRYKIYRDEKFYSPKYYYEQGGYDLLEQIENEKASLLKELGFNLNLAPVADLSSNEDDFIYSRSFSGDKEKTSEFIKNMVTYANNNKINSCLKHFPGYGNNKDSHKKIVFDERSYEEISNNDYVPFIAGIEAKVPCILVSHNLVTSIDEDFPASLSEKVHKELREKLNFTGIIMTDELSMGALDIFKKDRLAATLALNAGNDIIVTSDFLNMREELLNSYKSGIIKEETINKAVLRVIAWKYYSGILK